MRFDDQHSWEFMCNAYDVVYIFSAELPSRCCTICFKILKNTHRGKQFLEICFSNLYKLYDDPILHTYYSTFYEIYDPISLHLRKHIVRKPIPKIYLY